MKKWLDLGKVAVLPILYFLLVSAEREGIIDRWLGLDLVENVAKRFSLSYAADASSPVYPTDPAWEPLMKVIGKYSRAKLRTDKLPQTVARFQATLSTQLKLPGGQILEWTSPSTPFVVLYVHWPTNSGQDIPLDDYTIVGTIGELQDWIMQSKSHFHFLIHDVVLGMLTLVVAYSVWHMNHLQPPAVRKEPVPN